MKCPIHTQMVSVIKLAKFIEKDYLLGTLVNSFACFHLT